MNVHDIAMSRKKVHQLLLRYCRRQVVKIYLGIHRRRGLFRGAIILSAEGILKDGAGDPAVPFP
jgi:hypothetical protein